MSKSIIAWLNKRRQKHETERILENIRWRYRKAERISEEIYAEAMVLEASYAILNAWYMVMEANLEHHQRQVREIKDVRMRELFRELCDCHSAVIEQTGILLSYVMSKQIWLVSEIARIRINYAMFRGDIYFSEYGEGGMTIKNLMTVIEKEIHDVMEELSRRSDMNHGPYQAFQQAKRMCGTVNDLAIQFSIGQMKLHQVVLNAQGVSWHEGSSKIQDYVGSETHKHVLYLAMKQAEIILIQNPEALDALSSEVWRELSEMLIVEKQALAISISRDRWSNLEISISRGRWSERRSRTFPL